MFRSAGLDVTQARTVMTVVVSSARIAGPVLLVVESLVRRRRAATRALASMPETQYQIKHHPPTEASARRSDPSRRLKRRLPISWHGCRAECLELHLP